MHLAQSVGAAEYTDCISVERYDSPNDCPWYDIKQSDGEALGMWSTLSLPLLPGPLWPRLVAPDRVLFMGQIELNCVIMLNWIIWNRLFLHLTVFKLYT